MSVKREQIIIAIATALVMAGIAYITMFGVP